MGKKLCIHGHFYQPPREDPWFGKIFIEGSAAPMRHWNERITSESYAPLAWARRLDGQGRIADLMNCYEWISFNVGPTLMHWLERQEPRLLERIIEADRLSLARWGHGNAIAQVFHHVILPLASELDKEVEIEWALADFRHYFGRESEGIWLSECAADIATLEAVAAKGIKFVVLSPHQARLVRENGEERQVNAASLDYGRPYNISLPSGKKVAAFFYEAALAQSVAFEGLLSDGEKFWQKIRVTAEAMQGPDGLLTLATDGETYGHHFTFGEMALAYVLGQGYSGRDGLELTNFGAYLSAHTAGGAPLAEVELYEPSSWSCTHGVERWRSDCGDTTGGHPGWNQKWRAPLREALDLVKKNVDEHYFKAGKELFNSPRAALLDFGKVIADRAAAGPFVAEHFKEAARGGQGEAKAWLILRMQEHALAAYASCAWFFDEISRIEPVNALRFALLCMETMEATGGPAIQEQVEAILQKAVSNLPEEGSGKDIFRRWVLPSRQDTAKICLYSYLFAFASGRLPKFGEVERIDYPSLSVHLYVDEYGADGACKGRAILTAPESSGGASFGWSGILPYEGSKRFVSFAEARLEAWPDDARAKPVWAAEGDKLAWYLKDYLGVVMMKTLLNKQQGSRLAAAGQALSTAHPFEEAQNTQNLSQFWSQFVVYMPLAVYQAPLADEALAQTEKILAEMLGGYPAQQGARDLLNAAVLKDLTDEIKPDAAIAAGIARVNSVFRCADWWHAQNALWRDGRVRPEYKETARVLGFRL